LGRPPSASIGYSCKTRQSGRIETAAAVPEAEGRRLATGRVSECDGTSQGARGWLRGGGGAGVGARDASWHLRVGIFASPW